MAGNREQPVAWAEDGAPGIKGSKDQITHIILRNDARRVHTWCYESTVSPRKASN